MSQAFRPAPRTIGTKLTTTGQTAVFTAAGANLTEVVEWIRMTNTTALAGTLLLEWTDASEAVTYTLMGTETIAPNSSATLELGAAFPPGDALKATAGTANAFQIIVAVEEMGRSS